VAIRVNQYSTTPSDNRDYSDKGSLVAIDLGQPTEKTLVFNWKEQLTSVTDASTGQTHEYLCDVFGRRIQKVIDALGVAFGPIVTTFVHDPAGGVLEDLDGGGTPAANYVHYGPRLAGMPRIISMQRFGNDTYYHCDDQQNVMATSDGAGNVVERWDYGDYGAVLDPVNLAAIAGNPSATGNPYYFGQQRYDPET